MGWNLVENAFIGSSVARCFPSCHSSSRGLKTQTFSTSNLPTAQEIRQKNKTKTHKNNTEKERRREKSEREEREKSERKEREK